MRKQLVYGVLLAAFGFGSVSAKMHTNKTFLMPRSHNENMAMENTTWHKTTRAIDESGDKFGAAIQAVPFWQQSENDTDLGKYFGMHNNANGIAPNVNKTLWNPYSGDIQDFIWVHKDGAPGNLHMHYQSLLLDPSFIFLGATAPYINVRGQLRPDSESYGVRLDYHQKLDKLAKGLYLKVTAPIVEVKNNMGISYTSTSNQLTQAAAGSPSHAAATLGDFLSGNYENTNATYRQYKLTHAKIGSDSTSGVADVDVTLGYNFMYSEKKHCGVNVCMTIPTGGSPNGDMLFEAVCGNGGHFALGMGIDGAFELWKSGNKSLEMIYSANYKYLFDSTEMRTLNITYSTHESTALYNLSNKTIGHGFYLLGGKIGSTGVFPLANVLTREVGVHPGSMFEGMASFALNWGKFTWDLGYNLFAKEGESVMVKNWPENTYAIASSDYDASGGAFAVSDSYWYSRGSGDDRYILSTNLIPAAATSPVYVTHKIFTGMGFNYDWRFPILAGIGGSWEFAQGSNSALAGWALWGKLGVSF